MPPSNTTSTLPSHTASALSRATKTDSSSNATPIIIGVSVGAGSLVLLVAVYKLWRFVTQRSKAPLPPKRPLAHHFQRQMAVAYPRSDLDYPRSTEVPLQNTTSVGAVQFRDGIRQLNERFDDTSIPPSPSVVSSQVQLVRTSTGSEENSDTQFSSPVSYNNSTITRHHRGRQRRFSAPGSVHSDRSRQSSASGTIRGRGPPHARHSRVDVVLPQPLAPRLYHGNNASGHSQLSYGERRLESREVYETSIHDLPTPLHEKRGHDFRQYPPPAPLSLPSYTSSLSPIIASPNVTDSVPPAARAPVSSQPGPSPERGPPPLPPPKDTPPRPSGRTR